jgi:hypothetical protein
LKWPQTINKDHFEVLKPLEHLQMTPIQSIILKDVLPELGSYEMTFQKQ